MPPSSAQPDLGPILRKTTIVVFPPAFLLCLIHGIITNKAVPALGLIPLAGSALLGLFLLYRDKLAGGGSPIRLTFSQILIADTLLACVLFVILVISWIVVPDEYEGPPTMLGTYATVPLMINIACHCYLALRIVQSSLALASQHHSEYNGLMGTDRGAYTPISEADAISYQDVEEGNAQPLS
ncbi:MAG: hypothetical protein Q9227_006625 [Pyrenula ochraceoflavens]